MLGWYLSVSAFIKRFSDEFRMPPMRWLMNLRLHHAKALLMRSELTVGEVAQACGFRDPLYFTRQFRRQTGYPPSKYRQLGHGRMQIVSGENYRFDETLLDRS